MLVHKRIFATIEIHYLPKGHTHENVDHFFSAICKLLKHMNALTLEKLLQLFEKAYS